MNDKIIGRNPVLEAIRSGRSVDKILVKKGKYEGSIVPIIKKAKDAGIIIVSVHTVLLFRKEIQLVLTVSSQKLRQVRLNIHLLQRLQISLTRLTA